MLQVIGNIHLLGLLTGGALAWGFARVLDAPPWSGRAILLVIVLIACFAQIVLPESAVLRRSTGGAVTAALWLGVAAVPILAYRWGLRKLRQPQAPKRHPEGFVIIPDDAALVQDIAGRLGAEVPGAEVFSIAHRSPEGAIQASLRVHLVQDTAHLQNIWVDPEVDLAEDLLDTAERAARDRRAEALVVAASDPEQAAWLARNGFTRLGSALHTKPLP